jgi:hypothetical protein
MQQKWPVHIPHSSTVVKGRALIGLSKARALSSKSHGSAVVAAVGAVGTAGVLRTEGMAQAVINSCDGCLPDSLSVVPVAEDSVVELDSAAGSRDSLWN